MRRCLTLLLLGSLLLIPLHSQAADQYVPTRYGVALLGGGAYDPETIGIVLVQGQMVIDYDRVFWHAAPEPLRLKLEGNAGLTTDGNCRGIMSVDMLALYYLNKFKFGLWLPYVEGGIGIIYTDFQVDGQGSRINFNPQLGIGVEYPVSHGGAVTFGLRLHHLSNANLMDDNRGVNSALLQIGYLF